MQRSQHYGGGPEDDAAISACSRMRRLTIVEEIAIMPRVVAPAS